MIWEYHNFWKHLVGGWTNPFEQYESKWGESSPIFGVKIPKILGNPPPRHPFHEHFLVPSLRPYWTPQLESSKFHRSRAINFDNANAWCLVHVGGPGSPSKGRRGWMIWGVFSCPIRLYLDDLGIEWLGRFYTGLYLDDLDLFGCVQNLVKKLKNQTNTGST